MVKVSAFYALGAKQPPYDDLVALIRPVYDAFGAQRLIWASDCPLAAIQFQQHAGRKPMHPMSILARAYREDGFAQKVEPT